VPDLGRHLVDSAVTEIQRAEAADSLYGQLLETAPARIRDARPRYVDADPYTKRLLNHNMLERIEVKDGQLVSVELKRPVNGLFLLAGSNKGSLAGGTGHFSITPQPQHHEGECDDDHTLDRGLGAVAELDECGYGEVRDEPPVTERSVSAAALGRPRRGHGRSHDKHEQHPERGGDAEAHGQPRQARSVEGSTRRQR